MHEYAWFPNHEYAWFLKPLKNQQICFEYLQQHRESIFLLLVSTWSHFVPTWSPLVPTWSNLVPTWSNLVPTWSPLGPIWSALGPTLVPFGPHLVLSCSHFVPIRSGDSSGVLGSRKASKSSEESTLSDFGTHLGLWPSWGLLGDVLEMSWAIFGEYLDVLEASWRVLERLARCLRVVLG